MHIPASAFLQPFGFEKRDISHISRARLRIRRQHESLRQRRFTARYLRTRERHGEVADLVRHRCRGPELSRQGGQQLACDEIPASVVRRWFIRKCEERVSECRYSGSE